MIDEPLLVKDLGEHGLLKKLQSYCPREIIGDDGAVLGITPGKSLVVTTDVLVDGVHFSDRTTTAFDVGWRAAAANLSDLAAMGANPLGITVGLSLPGEKAVDWVEKLYQGMKACLEVYGTSIVGGDICRSAVTSIAITAFGEVLPTRIIRRSNAKPGDVIVITGLHGLSRGGLEILLDSSKSKNLEFQERERLIEAHQRPKPRLDVLPYLAQIPENIAISGMDSSDGLADAIKQICSYSGVGATINGENLHIFSGLTKLAGLAKAGEWLLYGGEDFELVLSLPLNFALSLVENLSFDAAIIGEITQGCEIKIINGKSHSFQLTLNEAQGFQHF
ncbi:thiamine-phosphate kinase [Pleurocapsa sp. FMAR1]|uniref:thiamine-phosphate kinase n=1 Tax=Pleurocapsa sp. FMAR1 TaxID=3040204 RepID=UPI0029C9113A|nr:thiamine-phosphate kinase [Pleurocapsa sp. FMAR1]